MKNRVIQHGLGKLYGLFTSLFASDKKSDSGTYPDEVHRGMADIGCVLEAPLNSQAIMSFDQKLLEKTRTQFQFGDWNSLASISEQTLSHHPDRAKISALVAVAHSQLGANDEMARFGQRAKDWGCSRELLSRILISSACVSLSRAWLSVGNKNKAESLMSESVAIGLPAVDQKLVVEARLLSQTRQLGLLNQAVGDISKTLKGDRYISQNQALLKVCQTELELLQHELSISLQRGQLDQFGSRPKSVDGNGADQSVDSDALLKLSTSQLGQDVWVLEQLGFKHGGFFVEFGATDGVLLSNSYLLEKQFGWTGVCAEPNPLFFQRLKSNRSCSVSNLFIGSKSGRQRELILAGAFGSDVTVADNDQHSDKRAAFEQIGEKVFVEEISLQDLLTKYDAPKSIDYLSIDTEGTEFEIIKNFPFHEWDIKCITIEHNFTDQRSKIESLLSSHGYTKTEAQWDDWYFKQ